MLVEGRPAGGEFALVRSLDIDPSALPFQLSVAPMEEDATREWRIGGYAFEPGVTTPWLSQRYSGSHVEGESRVLRILLVSGCATTNCPAAQTCRGGDCVPESATLTEVYQGGRVPPVEPPGPDCTEDGLPRRRSLLQRNAGLRRGCLRRGRPAVQRGRLR